MKEFCWSTKVSKNKSIEIQFGIWEWQNASYFDFSSRWNQKQDHAGLSLMLELFGAHFYFQFYDTRHWDDDNDKWHDPHYYDSHYYDPETFLPS